MPTHEQLLTEAQQCNAAADRLVEGVKKGTIVLESFITTDGEQQPPQAAVAIGALRQRARRLREQVRAN